MSVPFICGKLIYFTGFSESDAEALGRWLDNSNVTAFLEMGRRPFRQSDARRIANNANENENEIVFSIFEKSTDSIIGICGLYAIDWISRRAQLNIIIGEEVAWNRGFGAEACSLTLEYAFKKLNLNSVQLGVNSKNERAIRAYEKAGFVYEGTRRQFLFCNGNYCDMLFFSVLREEFSDGM